MLYCAIIADIIDSKRIAERGPVQERLRSVLAEANEKYREHIASAFTLTLGDEFQGLLNGAEQAFYIIEFIQREVHPVRLRFGLGLDDISTRINPDISIGADGPAYYSARSMIENIKSKERSIYSYQPEIFFKSRVCDDGLINSTALLLRQLERNWTDKQRQYINYFFGVTENQTAIAAHFGVKQSSINKAFERAGLYRYLYALGQLHEYFVKNNF